MNRFLMQLVVDMVTFLALSDEEAVDQDVAVSQLEQISATLNEMRADDLAAFLAFVGEQQREAASSGEVARAEFLASFPEHLGLEE
jgi:hypothetical protein